MNGQTDGINILHKEGCGLIDFVVFAVLVSPSTEYMVPGWNSGQAVARPCRITYAVNFARTYSQTDRNTILHQGVRVAPLKLFRAALLALSCDKIPGGRRPLILRGYTDRRAEELNYVQDSG